MSDSIFIVYLNRFNEAKAYEVEVLSEGGEDTVVFDWRQDKYKTLKTSKILSLKESYREALEVAKVLQENYSIIPKNKTGRRWKNVSNKFEVCFTGFNKAEKDKLIILAKDHNMYVRSVVTKNIGLLVCGERAGPMKMKKANVEGVSCVFGADGFHQFIEIGEVAE